MLPTSDDIYTVGKLVLIFVREMEVRPPPSLSLSLSLSLTHTHTHTHTLILTFASQPGNGNDGNRRGNCHKGDGHGNRKSYPRKRSSLTEILFDPICPRDTGGAVKLKRKRSQRIISRERETAALSLLGGLNSGESNRRAHGVSKRGGHVRRKRKLNNSHVVIYQETNVSV